MILVFKVAAFLWVRLTHTHTHTYNLNLINFPSFNPTEATDTEILYYSPLLSAPQWRQLRKQIQLFDLMFTFSVLGFLPGCLCLWSFWEKVVEKAKIHYIVFIAGLYMKAAGEWVSELWSSNWQCDKLFLLLFCFYIVVFFFLLKTEMWDFLNLTSPDKTRQEAIKKTPERIHKNLTLFTLCYEKVLVSQFITHMRMTVSKKFSNSEILLIFYWGKGSFVTKCFGMMIVLLNSERSDLSGHVIRLCVMVWGHTLLLEIVGFQVSQDIGHEWDRPCT